MERGEARNNGKDVHAQSEASKEANGSSISPRSLN